MMAFNCMTHSGMVHGGFWVVFGNGVEGPIVQELVDQYIEGVSSEWHIVQECPLKNSACQLHVAVDIYTQCSTMNNIYNNY